MTERWSLASVALLGAWHGIDPSMGWLFAVALGLQERSRSKVLGALPPIAAGHLGSVGLTVALIETIGMVIPPLALRFSGAAALIGLGMFRYFKPGRHPRWVTMRVSAGALVLWSFLMATAHGAGLMLFPIIIATAHRHATAGLALAQAYHGTVGPVAAVGASALLLVAVHTAALTVVMGVVALLVYEKLGLAFLRSAWINLDVLWAGALMGAGVLSLIL